MWSGLLPPGVNESDIDTSSDDEKILDGPVPTLKEEKERTDCKSIQASNMRKTQEFENIAESKPASAAVVDEVQEFQACPSGVSLDMWNKFQNLQKKNFEMKIQVNQRERGKKRKRSRKAKLKKNNEEVTESQPSTKESQLKELTQFFGINDRFKPIASKETSRKSGLELSIDKSLAEGDVAQAEELSDQLATRELGVKVAKAVACRNFVKAKQDAEASQEAQKKKKLAWGFEAKKRWETKSNMGYM
ncbi:protein FAM204A [Hemicordylus capensis]|uniref:protein FAM204A n=1 Tax=Hemicordylus capensis TaxID=884348 RepID=UPI00230464ED|nr:protein FAM204A [Hemicordylus capensis]XP_053166743.1 protein FAM204A [Hemicordylus capensis]XP_053166744.1 protein FAM204A [Hemicordylus capensis]XP_053166745.1 protein FAM204A [Hemicordylus capensis]XP_053166746.1 protein FAM204A [Hemicordylus capensis]